MPTEPARPWPANHPPADPRLAIPSSTGAVASVDEGGEAPCFAHLLDQLDPAAGPSDELLARMVRELADAVIICDPGGSIVLWNDAASKLFGHDPSQAIGQPLDLIIPERLRQRHWDGFRHVMRTGHTDYGDRLLEVPALHRDGRRLSIAFTVTLLHMPGRREPIGVAAVIRDDTEHWQERRQLQTEVSELRSRIATSDQKP